MHILQQLFNNLLIVVGITTIIILVLGQIANWWIKPRRRKLPRRHW